ncbi:MAG: transporter [Bacteriovoracaceae bacterium]|nr:transporter [Bacteriovoracaceae bacterium]
MQNAYSAGISVDAGLTPSEKRWIFREQIRFNSRSEDPSMMNREMTQNSLMTVLAYGLKRDITLVVKQMYMDMDMQMGGNTTKTSGFMDTGLLIKYGVFRENTASRILGAAATLEIELPTGKKGISSETWDLKPGLYFSMRKGNWLGDFSFVYTFNGVGDSSKTKTIPGDQFSINTAFAYQTTLGEGADKALAYVLELSHEKVYTSHLNSKAVRNTGEDMTLISPGLKLTISSFVTELLLQIPTSQNQKGNQLKRDVGGLFGIRYMF